MHKNVSRAKKEQENRKRHILQDSGTCCWLSLRGQRASVQMLPPAVLSHHTSLAVSFSYNADILNKILEMQAARCPQNEKGRNKHRHLAHVHTEPR